MAVELSKPNGTKNLPASREAAVQQGLAYYQEIGAERDQLAREVALLKSEIAAHKVCVEAQSSQITMLESRTTSAMIERDKAVEAKAEYRTLLVSIQAQLRAFGIEHEPLVRGMGDSEQNE